MSQQNLSEVAALRKKIEAECQAITLGLTGLSLVAQHRIIARRYHSLDTHYEALEKIVGEEEAANIIFTIHDQEVQ